MYIDNLILEVTRQCNLRCSHCLRGSAQRLKMSTDILTRACAGNYICTVTFTGGEPSLACDVIEEFINLVKWRGTTFSHFYVVTNAKTRNGFKRFLGLLDDLYGRADEQAACSLVVSQDQYHQNEHKINLWKLRGKYDEYPPYFYADQRKDRLYNLVNEGRAHENQLSGCDPEQQRPWQCRESDGELQVMEENLYIAANGNVVSNCDMSFKRIDQESKGNVLQTPLEDIVRSYCVMEQEEPIAVTA